MGFLIQIRRRVAPHPAWRVRESKVLYRPRRPERTAFYQIFEHHFDRHVGFCEERFEHPYEPFRPAVPHAEEEFLACGRLLDGFAAQIGNPRTLPGVVATVQTFSSFANFHPHIHALLSEAVWGRKGDSSPVPFPDSPLVEELFRRLLLIGLHSAKRLSEEFLLSLLSWRRSGFSVLAGEPLPPGEPRLERLARYLARPPPACSQVEIDSENRVHLRTPPHPHTGETEIVFDPLEFVHAVVAQIPDRRQHLVRYYGVYANRSRKIWRERITGKKDRRSPGPHRHLEWAEPRESSLPSNEAGTPAPTSHRASWARLLTARGQRSLPRKGEDARPDPLENTRL